MKRMICIFWCFVLTLVFAFSAAGETLSEEDLLQWTIIDDRGAEVVYNGSGWTKHADENDYMGTHTFNRSREGSCDFTAWCTQLALGVRMGPGAGIVDIYVDGEFVETLDCYAASKTYQQTVYTSPALPAGNHTLTLMADSNNGNSIMVDYFMYVAAPKEDWQVCVELIEAIGTVSLRPVSLNRITAAENAYAALTEAEKERVWNYTTLVEARRSYDALAAGLQDSDITISVETLSERKSVDRYVISANHRYPYNGYGMYDAENRSVYSDFVEKTAEVGYGLIRYPAGTIGNTFKWKDSIGELESRNYEVLGSDFTSCFPVYGLDEHMDYVEQIGSDAICVVGMSQETPADAADLVEYLNAPNDGSNPNGGTDWAAVRAANGHDEPYGVRHFEIGNEMNQQKQYYWLAYPSAIYPDGTSLAERYTRGDTVQITGAPARRYGYWTENLSSGAAKQRFYSQYAPVKTGSQTVYVDGEPWTQTSDLSAAGADDRVYTFDAAEGEIRFGDGVHGAIPPGGAAITMDYQYVQAGFLGFYKAMKAVDPDISVYSCFADVYKYLDPYECDGLVFHDYFSVTTESGDAPKTAEELHDSYMGAADDIIHSFSSNLSTLRSLSGRNDTVSAVTEYGSIPIPTVWSDGGGTQLDEARILSRGVSLASVLCAAVSTEQQILIHQGFTAYSFGGGPGLSGAGWVCNSLYAQNPDDLSETIESSMALAYKIVGNAVGDRVASSFIQNNPVIEGARTYDALYTAATQDEETGDLYLIVVNRDPVTSYTATVDLNGYTISGVAEVSALCGENFTSCNTPEHPQDVFITNTTEELGVGESSFEYTFPACSVITFRLSGSKQDNWAELEESCDFEGISGGLPSPFHVTGGIASLSADPEDDGNQTLRLTRSNTAAVCQADFSLPPEDLTGFVKISARVRALQPNAGMNILILSGDAQIANMNFSAGRIKNDGRVRHCFDANTWYDVEFLLDTASKKYYLFVDGNYLYSRVEYNQETETLPDGVCFLMNDGDGSFLIDDLRIAYTSVELGEAALLPGDASGDGQITVSDVVALRLAILAGTRAEDLPAGDLDGNGQLTVSDVVALRQKIVRS